MPSTTEKRLAAYGIRSLSPTEKEKSNVHDDKPMESNLKLVPAVISKVGFDEECNK